ncbi:hypothetical protein FI667_g2701, partial [Globisporangium splendens]
MHVAAAIAVTCPHLGRCACCGLPFGHELYPEQVVFTSSTWLSACELHSACAHILVCYATTCRNVCLVRWNFDDGTDGWAQSTPMEMSIEVDAINGNLRGIVLPNSKFGRAFVGSPELRVEVRADERDHLVFRMKYVGQCDRGMVSLERNAKEPSVDPGPRRERTVFHDPVDIPFNVRDNGVDSDLHYIPIWKHITGTVHRVRFYPCIASPKTMDQTSSQQFGQTFHIDWIAFAKGKMLLNLLSLELGIVAFSYLNPADIYM